MRGHEDMIADSGSRSPERTVAMKDEQAKAIRGARSVNRIPY